MNNKIVFVLISLTSFSLAQRVDSIVRVGACETPGWADGVFVQAQYAYIADRGGVTSVDISNPSVPNVLDYLNQPPSGATGIYTQDTLAFINSALGGPALTIINIADPSSLLIISWVVVPGYGGDEPKGVYARDTLTYFADSDGGFLIINIADLLNPTILCTLNTPGRVIDLYVRDTLAYLADLYSLLIVNISDPYSPSIIGSLSIPGSGAYDVWVSGNYAFVTEEDFFGGQGKVNMIDVSNPTTPTLMKQISMAATPYGLFVVNDRVYVAADDWWSPLKDKEKDRADIEGGIRVVHWEAPDSMNLLVSFDTPGRCRDIFVVDSFIYVTVVDSFMIYKYINTGITENEKRYLEPISSFEVYPNPMATNITCALGLRQSCRISIDVYDEVGRKIENIFEGLVVAGKKIINWDCKDEKSRHIAKGIYFVKVKTLESKFQECKKIVYFGGE